MAGRFWNQEPQYRSILAEEYNSAVSIVFMKLTQPEPGQFRFDEMDREMQFANEHNIKLFGSALIYRGDVSPEWLIAPWRHGSGIPANQLDRILKDHIQTVVRHGGNTFSAWEVVNEPLSAPNDPWGKVFGREGYISKAFHYAREANPNAQLVLNQAFGAGGVDRDMTDEFFELIRRLKSSGVPIDVAGIELHLQAQLLTPGYLDELRYFLSAARGAGVQVQITEMDVYQGPSGFFSDPFINQKQIYHDVLSTCLGDTGCTGFYTWGLTDAHNWLAQRQTDRLPDAKPLLFDESYRKKPAYFGVVEALQERLARTQ